MFHARGFRRNRACRRRVDLLLPVVSSRRDAMTRYFGGAAVAIALVSGIGTAGAQTVITREITSEPVETIVEQGPTGTVITRRPLEAAVPGSPLRLRSDTFVATPVETVAAPVEETTGV